VGLKKLCPKFIEYFKTADNIKSYEITCLILHDLLFDGYLNTGRKAELYLYVNEEFCCNESTQ
jgi:hypothetical protein